MTKNEISKNINNYIGKKINKLKILSLTNSHRKWATCVLAQCDCGSIKPYVLCEIKNGHTKSCGCSRASSFLKVITKHGKINHPLYNHWIAMKQRCYGKRQLGYKNYGGRGIIVCKKWCNSFQSFYDWAILNGWEKGLSLDRRDNNGNYTPDNCRWATRGMQATNTRANVFVTYKGKKMTLSEWDKKLGFKSGHLRQRIQTLGWSIKKAIETPLKTNPRGNREV